MESRSPGTFPEESPEVDKELPNSLRHQGNVTHDMGHGLWKTKGALGSTTIP